MDVEQLKVLADSSTQVLTWTLAIGAGSVAAVLGTEYARPGRRFRRFYLLFIPAWLFLGLSIYHADQVARRYLAAVLGRPERLKDIAGAMNESLGSQYAWLNWGLGTLGLWLTCFLLWWIFFSETTKKKGAEA